MGPTVWMTYLAGRRPPVVRTALPAGRRPILATMRLHSSRIEGPPARWMAPSTPPPPRSEELAALTMASVVSLVMSAGPTNSRILLLTNVSLATKSGMVLGLSQQVAGEGARHNCRRGAGATIYGFASRHYLAIFFATNSTYVANWSGLPGGASSNFSFTESGPTRV